VAVLAIFHDYECIRVFDDAKRGLNSDCIGTGTRRRRVLFTFRGNISNYEFYDQCSAACCPRRNFSFHLQRLGSSYQPKKSPMLVVERRPSGCAALFEKPQKNFVVGGGGYLTRMEEVQRRFAKGFEERRRASRHALNDDVSWTDIPSTRNLRARRAGDHISEA